MNSVFKCLMSAVCAVALPAFGQEEKTGFPTDRAVTVFSAGEGNPYASIRIPALLSIGKGQLLAFAEGRYKNTDQGENDIIMSVSKNGGKTWSRPRAIAKAHGATFNNRALFMTAKTDRDCQCSSVTLPGSRSGSPISRTDGMMKSASAIS